MTTAQKAMAAKPNIAELRRSAEAMRPPEQLTKHRQFEFRGWTVRVFDSPYAAGVLLVCADRPCGSIDGDTPVSLSEEVATQTEADAWVARMVPADGAAR